MNIRTIQGRKGASIQVTTDRVNGGMVTVDGKQRSCRIIAHRGYWKDKGSYENSIAAIDAAVELGVDGIEFDLWRTKDDTIVVNHNSMFDGKYIPGTLYSELIQTLLPNGERLPTLREYLLRIKSYPHLILFVEFKSTQAVEPTIKMLSDEGIKNPLFFLSFTQDACRRTMNLSPGSHVELLQQVGEPIPTDSLYAWGYSGLAYQVTFYKKNPIVILDAHRLNLTLSSWTVNSSWEYDDLFENGFSFAISDNPDLLVKQTLGNPLYWRDIN